jgi:hypothetical protein
MRDECPKCGRVLVNPQIAIPTSTIERVPRKEPRMPKLNGTEKRWLEERADDFPTALVIPHALILPLDGGGTYRPDFFVLEGDACIHLIEIKGGYVGPGWEQGIERFRRARTQWGKYFNFQMWEWHKDTKKWTVES